MKKSLDLTLGQIELHVKNLDKEISFYKDVLNLEIIDSSATRATLGKHGHPLLQLITSDAPRAVATHAGLYHFAILFESRGELARTVLSVLKHMPELYSGSADHLVSEAFYLNDPEGNGIELYFDREKTKWNWKNNQVEMATISLPPREYLESYVTLEEPNTSVRMGHFHLKVGDIELAKSFYVDVLGFEVTAAFPGALFISVNGYHHHLGLNTWESAHAGKRVETLGLKSIEFVLPDREALKRIEAKLSKAKISFASEKMSVTFQDPWGNHIRMITLA